MQFVFLRYNWPGISWALFIFIISSITPPSIYIPDLFDLFAPDKIVHFIVYGVLCFLMIHGFSKTPSVYLNRNKFLPAILITAAYGGLIEIYQGCLLPNRTGDWVDFLANCIGTFIGYCAMKIFIRYQLKKKSV